MFLHTSSIQVALFLNDFPAQGRTEVLYHHGLSWYSFRATQNVAEEAPTSCRDVLLDGIVGVVDMGNAAD
uniref:AlNc14C1G163 protein n=1 Tax=Albugo laibachii Nc14 TaxID=890382 RepID=F0VZ17_9STRA|nr:AlNc14C1G163 [Albugo laibachii Nc14]|eukprot:CCA14032.1 AlNc14C1G163 [Albugo laibachii Nc14]